MPVRYTHCIECKREMKEYEKKFTYTNYGYVQRKYCKYCWAARKKKQEADRKAKFPEKFKEQRDAAFRRCKYGLTREAYQNLITSQHNLCAICKGECSTGEVLSVDHDKATGTVRGLLCRQCNLAIGLLRENEVIFWNAIEYLKNHKWSKAA